MEHRSVLSLYNAHRDHIKKVIYLNENEVISGSYDKTVKIWDLRNHREPFSTFKFDNPVEDFCMMPFDQVAVANGN